MKWILSGMVLWMLAAVAGAVIPVTQEWHRVAIEDFGVTAPHPFLVAGGAYRFSTAEVSEDQVPADDPLRHVAFGERVTFSFGGLDPTARYRVRLTLLSDQIRVQRLSADQKVLREQIELQKARPRTLDVELPAATFADGAVVLSMDRVSGPNAVVSSLEILSTQPRMLQTVERRVVLTEAEQQELEWEYQRLRPAATPRPVRVSGVAQPLLRLDGTWSFHPAPESGFAEQAEPASDWQPIQVPGEWAMQGFTVAPGDAAGYRRRFEVPADWAGTLLRLRFDAVYSQCTVWLNGHQLGTHQGGFTPFELDATAAARPGTNWLALAVRNDSDADVLASATQYAAHPLGGIPRKVTLFAVPPVHLSRLNVTTEIREQGRLPILQVRTAVSQQGPEASDHLTIRYQVMPWGTETDAGIAEWERPLEPLGPGTTTGTEDRIPVPRARLWDAEHPNLYRLVAELRNGEHVLETAEVRFGFREVEVRGQELLVNGRPVKLRGVNRHEVHPLRGRSLTDELWRTDARLFQEANCNFIRTSHYPPAEEFLAACDEVGLFVELEAPLCWVRHAANPTWEKTDPDTERFFGVMLRANLETVEHSRNHPSVILRSLANESAWSANFERIARFVSVADPTRPLTFHDQCWGGYNNFGSNAMPVANMHYPGPDGPTQARAVGRPVLFGEYCHLNTYNRAELAADPGVREAYGRALLSMWEAMQSTEACVGGSIWSGIDDVFLLPDGRAVGYGEWGPLDGWRRPKPEYWHMKKVFSPVRVEGVEWETPGGGAPLRVAVENRHDFSNLDELTVEWAMGDAGGTTRVELAPRSRGSFYLPVEHPGSATLELRFRSPRGHLVDEVHLPIGDHRDSTQPALPVTPDPPVSAMEDGVLRIQDGAVEWRLDRTTARLRATVDGRPCLLGGPRLTVLPLATGPCRPDFDEPVEPLNGACRDFQLESLGTMRAEAGVRIALRGRHPEGVFRCELMFPGGGRLQASYEFDPAEGVDPRQVGLEFRVAPACQTLAWERDAQWTVYPEGHIGRPRGSASAALLGRRSANERRPPDWPWELDESDLGSHDFRATRRNIHFAELRDARGFGVRVDSDGHQAVRAWRGDSGIHLLVADFDTGGGDLFLASHYRQERAPLGDGETFRGAVKLQLLGAGVAD